MEGSLLWEPSSETRRHCNLTKFMEWLHEFRGLDFAGYHDLWRWSVTDLEGFWSSVWSFYQVEADKPYERVLGDSRMPGARWFVGSELNFARHALRYLDSEQPAIIFQSEFNGEIRLSGRELRRQVAAAAAGLRRLGVVRGDRV